MNRVLSTLLLISIFNSCSLKKVSNGNFHTPPKTAQELIKRVNSTNKIPDWLSIKGRITLTKQEKEVSLNINIKNRKDSIIWASISAPLGIELFRIQISKDSIYFINRSNKTYFIKPISHIREYLKTEISFSEINEIITATPKIIKGTYSFESDNNLYIIKSEKTKYEIDQIKYRIVQANVLENNDNNLIITFSEFKDISTYFFPHQCSLKIQSSENFSATLKYYRVINIKE